MKPRNPNNTMTFNNVQSKTANTVDSKADSTFKSWESLKTYNGPLSEPLLKPFNIASTALTPWISMMSTAYLGKAYTAFKILDGINKKFKKLNSCFDSSKRDDFNRKSVAYAVLKARRNGGRF